MDSLLPLDQRPPFSSNGAYLLRYWHEYEDSPDYRFMLKSVETGERILFNDAVSLLAYLRKNLLEEC